MGKTSPEAISIEKILGGIEKARITDVLTGRRVELALEPSGARFGAVLAAYGYDDPRPGDIVLVARSGDEVYVIGVLRALREAVEDPLSITFDPDTSTSEIKISKGDLELDVTAGKVTIRARDGVQLQTEQEISLASGQSVNVTAAVPGSELGSSLRVDPTRIDAKTGVLDLVSKHAHLASSTASLVAKQYQSRVDRVRYVAHVMETHTHRLVEKSVNSYREVEKIAQTRAGKIRSIAEKSVQILGGNVLVRSKKTVKVRGEKIYLA